MTRNSYFHIKSILQSSNAGKQILGQRIAAHLGLTPGPRGDDDGIDGLIVHNGQRIHFQSKLRSVRLDKDDAREYYSDIIFHKADVSLILSGVGFKTTFEDRLFGHDGISKVQIHLLELNDLFEKNEKYCKACSSLPELRVLTSDIRRNFGID
ncbi:hypothetical protein AB4374_02975 [Vibrio splendidus]|nr:restriction endonuclease [Vibrio splendidus]PMJ24449.1 hypothetical protein BCU26_06125 [Vibrio splendidus]